MTPEEWLGRIPVVARQLKASSQYVVLRAEQGAEDIVSAEQILQRSLPIHLKQALLENQGQSAWRMLETLAGLLTPGEDPLRLTPTGKPTAQVFPTLVRVLAASTEWAVFFDVDTPARSLLGGTRPAQVRPDAGTTSWACYLPVGSEALRAWEQWAGVQLSPQMWQLYLLMGGALDRGTWPFVYGSEEGIRGDLYEGIYGLEEVQEQLQLPEELVHLLQDFVELTYTIYGDSYGFFASEPCQGNEYHIYQWHTRERRFIPLVEDFSALVERLMTEEW